MMQKKIFTFFILGYAILFAKNVFSPNFYKYDTYFQAASKQFNIPFLLLKSIALTENYKFKSNIKKKNKNKTYDYGIMQINSIWLKKLQLKEKHILNPRINIFVAAYILRQIINKYGYSWESIGLYHSSTEKYKNKWLKRLKSNLFYIIKHDQRYEYALLNK